MSRKRNIKHADSKKDVFSILHSNLVEVKDRKALDEFMTVWKFRGGRFASEILQGIINIYFVLPNGEKDLNKSLLANVDDQNKCFVDNTEYQNLVDLKNIKYDKRAKND